MQNKTDTYSQPNITLKPHSDKERNTKSHRLPKNVVASVSSIARGAGKANVVRPHHVTRAVASRFAAQYCNMAKTWLGKNWGRWNRAKTWAGVRSWSMAREKLSWGEAGDTGGDKCPVDFFGCLAVF